MIEENQLYTLLRVCDSMRIVRIDFSFVSAEFVVILLELIDLTCRCGCVVRWPRSESDLVGLRG